MWTLRVAMVGVALIFLGGVGQPLAQVILSNEQKRAEDIAEGQIGDLRSRVACHEQLDGARQQARAAYNINRMMPGAREVRDAQLTEAEQQFRECDAQLATSRLRQTCVNLARTETQRAKCQ